MNEKVYCAGPLFTDKEREEMSEIAAALESVGFATFLPHRDGLEFRPLLRTLQSRGIEQDRATVFWNQAIFALDAFSVLVDSQALVLNMNGRVPDEGAVAEASMAWCAGKVVVGYKTDVRSLVLGQDNAMISGLIDFGTVSTPAQAARRVSELLNASGAPAATPSNKYLDLGAAISAALQEDSLEKVADVVLVFAGN
ncbi:MAG: nucleoside 2-deoxyribosyltransferase [Candidatus Binatia bacterium]|nr:nucleoside 2-deoxyribosyltransferase [Candidatus Binatia bacterium]